MKNIIKYTFFLITISMASSCGVGGAVSPVGANACDARAKDYEAAVAAWSSDFSNVSKCNAAKAATEKLINACTLYTVAQKKVYQDQLTQWKCN